MSDLKLVSYSLSPGGNQMEQVNNSSHSTSRKSGSSAVVECKRIRSGRWLSASSARSGSTKTVKISLSWFIKEIFYFYFLFTTLLIQLYLHNFDIVQLYSDKPESLNCKIAQFGYSISRLRKVLAESRDCCAL